MPDYTIKTLDEETWPAYARLVERHNGVWGGCWCMGFHPEGAQRVESVSERRNQKELRVRQGRTHAALVFDGENAVGWCQFGSPDELPRIKHRKEYLAGLAELPEWRRVPEWRITCFFVDKAYRRRGVAALALQGALDQIAGLGGGRVESYPEDVSGRLVNPGFIHNASLTVFERLGFERERRLGKNHWVVSRLVPPQSA